MRIGLTRQTVAAIEAGKYAPSLEAAFRIADVFGVPLAADELVITHGALEALNLCLQAVTEPGDAVIIVSSGSKVRVTRAPDGLPLQPAPVTMPTPAPGTRS